MATIWISYDLGVRGDYEGLYAWLDEHDAKECGDSVAVLSYRGAVPDDLRTELQDRVTIDNRTRIYVVYRDATTNRTKGKFIFGQRRAAAWAGYFLPQAATVDDEG